MKPMLYESMFGISGGNRKLIALNRLVCSKYPRIWLCVDQRAVDRRVHDLVHVVVSLAEGQGPQGFVVIGNGQPELLEVVRALHAPGGLPCRLHRRQKQGDQDRDDRDHDQKLDQGKRRATSVHWALLLSNDRNEIVVRMESIRQSTLSNGARMTRVRNGLRTVDRRWTAAQLLS